MNDRKELTGEIVVSSAGDRYTLPAIPASIIEAIHRTVVGNQESVTTYRRQNNEITLVDIQQLCYLLNQWIKPYGPISQTMSIVVNNQSNDLLKGNVRTRYRSIESFLDKAAARTDITLGMQVQFSFLFKNSDAESVDSLELVVDIAGSTEQYLYDLDDVANPLGGGWRVSNGRKPDEDEVTLQISAKYTNYLVAKSVIAVIDDWYKATKHVRLLSKSFAFSFLWRYDPYEFFTPIGFIIKIIPMLLATSIAWGFSRSSIAFDTEGYRVLSSVVVGVLVYVFADGALRAGFQAMRNIRGSLSVRLLVINPADQGAMQSYLESIDKKKESYDFWTKVIAAGIAVSIVGTGITTFLLGWN